MTNIPENVTLSPDAPRMHFIVRMLSVIGLTTALFCVVVAQAEEAHHDMGRERYHFHEHDVHRFGPHELALWRAGVWHQEWHDGRFGWWWAVGGIWYFYERPIYPYPMVVAGITAMQPVVVPVPGYAPPVSPQGTTVVAPQNGLPPTWFYCDSAGGYYPNVQQCPEPWRSVPAMPPGPSR
jgi:hypothetical protein